MTLLIFSFSIRLEGNSKTIRKNADYFTFFYGIYIRSRNAKSP